MKSGILDNNVLTSINTFINMQLCYPKLHVYIEMQPEEFFWVLILHQN